MSPNDLLSLFEDATPFEPPRVTVIANDYRYDGWLIMVGFKKHSRAMRCAVEDDFGRIFIHNASQIRSA